MVGVGWVGVGSDAPPRVQFEGDEVEEEADAFTQQVLAEIGVEVASHMAEAPSHAVGRGTAVAAPSSGEGVSDAELERMLAGLRSS